MSQCYKSGDFHKYFKENMNALGLDVPSGLFGSLKKASATATLILGTLKQLGKGATMAEVAGATIGLEKFFVASSLLASGYVGAVIGSMAIATQRSIGCGTRLSDMIAFQQRQGLSFPNSPIFFSQHPKIFDQNKPNRRTYAAKCLKLNS